MAGENQTTWKKTFPTVLRTLEIPHRLPQD